VQHLSAADRSETVLTLAGVAAHRGYLPLTTLIVLATIGSFIGDQVYSLIGRRFGEVFSHASQNCGRNANGGLPAHPLRWRIGDYRALQNGARASHSHRFGSCIRGFALSVIVGSAHP